MNLLDLGSCPGGWSQVAQKKIINGNLIYENTSFLNETRGKRLTFER